MPISFSRSSIRRVFGLESLCWNFQFRGSSALVLHESFQPGTTRQMKLDRRFFTVWVLLSTGDSSRESSVESTEESANKSSRQLQMAKVSTENFDLKLSYFQSKRIPSECSCLDSESESFGLFRVDK